MIVEHFYDPGTHSLTYLVYDANSKDAIVIDPVAVYDAKSSKISSQAVAPVILRLDELGLRLHWIFETHVHADHVTGAPYLKAAFPQAKTAIHQSICEVQKTWKTYFNFSDTFETTGQSFDHLFGDGDTLPAGKLKLRALHTPGHTPTCTSLLVNEHSLFVGDTLFTPDFGTGRCDFPGGSASQLFRSVQSKIFSLPDTTKIYVGHDYQPGGRELQFLSSVGEQKASNKQLQGSTTEDKFVSFRESRDQTLAPPQLLQISLQINAQAGTWPKPESNGLTYLKIPVARD